jgi:hypothetical protein
MEFVTPLIAGRKLSATIAILIGECVEVCIPPMPCVRSSDISCMRVPRKEQALDRQKIEIRKGTTYPDIEILVRYQYIHSIIIYYRVVRTAYFT